MSSQNKIVFLKKNPQRFATFFGIKKNRATIEEFV
jgi:hypothetical protein